MEKRVGILLMRHLLEAVRERRIDVADSEPYWLSPEQYRERDDGGMEFLPSEARERVQAMEASEPPVIVPTSMNLMLHAPATSGSRPTSRRRHRLRIKHATATTPQNRRTGSFFRNSLATIREFPAPPSPRGTG